MDVPAIVVVVAGAAAAVLLATALAAWLALRWARRHPLASRALALPGRRKLSLARQLLARNDVPLAAKLILPALVLYLALPFDIIPDFIPVLGYADDVLIIVGALIILMRLIPASVLEDAIKREEARAGRQEPRAG